MSTDYAAATARAEQAEEASRNAAVELARADQAEFERQTARAAEYDRRALEAVDLSDLDAEVESAKGEWERLLLEQPWVQAYRRWMLAHMRRAELAAYYRSTAERTGLSAPHEVSALPMTNVTPVLDQIELVITRDMYSIAREAVEDLHEDRNAYITGAA